MPKSQQYLIGLLISVLLFSVFVFRSDIFVVTGRPGFSLFLQSYVGKWGISLSFLMFGYFLSKLLKIKWIYPIGFLVVIEVLYIFLLNFSPLWLNDDAKLNPWFIHLKRMALQDRSMIQFEKDCAQYDSELFYTLKPGKSNFSSFEFDINLDVNSKGFRDAESDLNKPKVAFIGDSFTMGWGIEQDSTFEAIFQQKSGLKSLNLGISSYGTAREYSALNRIDTDSLKLLVLQFHDTDLAENNHFVTTGKLGNQTIDDYDYQVAYNASVKKYYLFKYLKTALIDIFTNDFFPNKNNKQEISLGQEFRQFPQYETEFFAIIKRIRNKYQGPILITYVGSFLTQPMVIDNFENYAKKNSIEGVYFLNMAKHLNHVEYFYLDDHINKKGHKKLADHIFEWYEREL